MPCGVCSLYLNNCVNMSVLCSHFVLVVMMVGLDPPIGLQGIKKKSNDKERALRRFLRQRDLMRWHHNVEQNLQAGAQYWRCQGTARKQVLFGCVDFNVFFHIEHGKFS